MVYKVKIVFLHSSLCALQLQNLIFGVLIYIIIDQL